MIRHILHNRTERGDLPIALRTKSVTLALQILNCKSGKLIKSVERAEVIDDTDISAFIFAEPIYRDFISRLFSNNIDAFRRHGILLFVFLHERVYIFFTHGTDIIYKVSDRIIIHLPAEFDMRLDLIPFRNCYIAHIIRKAADLDRLGKSVSRGNLTPGSKLFKRIGIFIVADDYLVIHSQTRYDITEFPVAVSRLILVHEIHVDGIVRNLLIELGVQVQKRLSVLMKSMSIVA